MITGLAVQIHAREETEMLSLICHAHHKNAWSEKGTVGNTVEEEYLFKWKDKWGIRRNGYKLTINTASMELKCL